MNNLGHDDWNLGNLGVISSNKGTCRSDDFKVGSKATGISIRDDLPFCKDGTNEKKVVVPVTPCRPSRSKISSSGQTWSLSFLCRNSTTSALSRSSLYDGSTEDELAALCKEQACLTPPPRRKQQQDHEMSAIMEFHSSHSCQPFPSACKEETPRRSAYQGHPYQGEHQSKELSEVSRPRPVRKSSAKVQRQKQQLTPQRNSMALPLTPRMPISSTPCFSPKHEQRPRSGSIECSGGSAFHRPARNTPSSNNTGGNQSNQSSKLQCLAKFSFQDDADEKEMPQIASVRRVSKTNLFLLGLQPRRTPSKHSFSMQSQANTCTESSSAGVQQGLLTTCTEQDETTRNLEEAAIGIMVTHADDDGVSSTSSIGEDDDESGFFLDTPADIKNDTCSAPTGLSPPSKRMLVVDFGDAGFRPVSRAPSAELLRAPSRAGYSTPQDAQLVNTNASTVLGVFKSTTDTIATTPTVALQPRGKLIFSDKLRKRKRPFFIPDTMDDEMGS